MRSSDLSLRARKDPKAPQLQHGAVTRIAQSNGDRVEVVESEATARQSPRLQGKRAAPTATAVPVKRNRGRPPAMAVASAVVSDTNVVSEEEERRLLDEECTDTNPSQSQMNLAIIRSLETQLNEIKDREREEKERVTENMRALEIAELKRRVNERDQMREYLHGAPPDKQTSELGRSHRSSESSFGLIYRKWPEFSGKRGENFESWMHQVNSFLGQAVFRHYSESEKANSL